MKKIVIIGGGAAGAKAASKAKRLEPNNQIELYTSGNDIAYSLCGLPYYIEDNIVDINKLIIKTPDDFIKMGIEVFTNSCLQEIYPDKNSVLINGNHIFYDELILALGALVRIPKIKNINATNVFTLRNLASAVAIKEVAKKSKKVILIGGGYTAIELAEAFLANDLEVAIIEKSNNLLNGFDDDFSNIVKNLIYQKTKRCEILLNEYVVEIVKDELNSFKGVVTNQNKTISADFCVLLTGIKPNVSVAKNAGIKLGPTGAIAVDNKMRTNFPNIFAAGDCAEKYSLITKQPIYIGLGTIANKEGRVSAINATSIDKAEIFDGVLNSTITKFFDYTISKTGISYKEAIRLSDIIDINPIEVNVTKNDKAIYMPDVGELNIKLIADKRSGELLGAQGIGRTGYIAQRINTISSVLKLRNTVYDILHLDLPYSPPFSGSVDPILTAAYKLKELLNK